MTEERNSFDGFVRVKDGVITEVSAGASRDFTSGEQSEGLLVREERLLEVEAHWTTNSVKYTWVTRRERNSVLIIPSSSS